jgi:hypothetical protein
MILVLETGFLFNAPNSNMPYFKSIIFQDWFHQDFI